VSIVSPVGLLAGHSQDARQLSQTVEQAFGSAASAFAGPARRPAGRAPGCGDAHLAPLHPDPWRRALAGAAGAAGERAASTAVALNQRLDDHNQRANLTSLLIGLGAAVLGLLLVWLTARGVTRPILAVAAR
jgi:methyl-accepting chemotaxis protein